MNVSFESADLVEANAVKASPLETELLRIWQDILETPEIGLHDDFFDLGGHSLLWIEMRSLIRDSLGISFLRLDILSTPTVSLLAQSIIQQLSAAVSEPGQRTEAAVL